MLLKVFKSTQTFVNVFTLIMVSVLWVPAFITGVNEDFTQILSIGVSWVDNILCILLISAQSIYLNIVASKYKLVKENSHVVSLVYLLLNCCCSFLLNLNQVVIANIFILVAFHQLLRMYNLKNNYAILFNASLLIGIASLIYFPIIIYFILLLIALVYTTTPKWRDFAISLIGIILPIIYFISYHFVIGTINDLSISNYMRNIFNVDWNEFSISLKTLTIILTTVSFMSFANVLQLLGRSIARVRKMLTVVVLMFIVGLVSLILNDFDYLATFIIVSIPLAIVVANFFQSIKKIWLAELFLMIFILGIVVSYFS